MRRRFENVNMAMGNCFSPVMEGSQFQWSGATPNDILPCLKCVGFLDTNARNPDIAIAGITLALQFGNALPKYIMGCKNIAVVNRSARWAHPRAVA